MTQHDSIHRQRLRETDLFRHSEPLVSLGDLDEFQAGLGSFKEGQWQEDRWKTFRLRFGVYEQRQIGQHMVRAKLPGGRLGFSQARAVAAANRAYAAGDVHITTRQDVQFYFLPLDVLPAFLGTLYRGGVTTREASGNTFRNTTACPLSGFCPSEKVDARAVAERLSVAWLRHPLTQHMPRKFKTAVSGCERDCGMTLIDDLGFIARQKNGRNGFRVIAGGGLGTQPRVAVEVFDFVSEDDLPAVQEAFARLHHEHSNRGNKNRSRIKFLVDRFGEEKFRALVREEFEKVRSLPHGPWESFAWREPTDDPADPPRLRGAILQPNGRYAVVVNVPLGLLSSDRFDALTSLAEENGATEFVLTRDQNIILLDLPVGARQTIIDGVRDLGLDASGGAAPMDDLVACPGTSTCPIGITNSYAFAETLLGSRQDFDGLPNVKIRISGCHNSCGHHHLGDVGLHGVAKKINGKNAPHYQLHLGGSPDRHGLAGPFIPAIRARDALKRLLEEMAESRTADESVRDWAERLGRERIKDILSPFLAGQGPAGEGEDSGFHSDIGSDAVFVPPATASGECAAGAVVAEYFADLAAVSRENVLRAASVGEIQEALDYGQQALLFPARRLLAIAGEDTGATPERTLDAVRQRWGHDRALMAALDAATKALPEAAATGEPHAAEPALRAWQSEAERRINTTLEGISSLLKAKVA